jgi:hypothetical protein
MNIAHGCHHNDTIVAVQRKVQEQTELDYEPVTDSGVHLFNIRNAEARIREACR